MSDEPCHDQEENSSTWTAEELAPALEALLFIATEPIAEVTLAEASGAPLPLVRSVLSELEQYYQNTARGFQLRQVGGGWQFATRLEHHDLIANWVMEGQQNRLTQAALETLAVIAYLQPVSRSRVSAVRGVNVDSVVRTLLMRGLVSDEGSDEVTGASTLRTTDYFLTRLGLSSLADLPDLAPYLPEATDLEAELVALANPALDFAEEPTVQEAE